MTQLAEPTAPNRTSPKQRSEVARRIRPGTFVGIPLGLIMLAGVAAPVLAVLGHVVSVDDVWDKITATLAQGPVRSALFGTLFLGISAGIVTTTLATSLAWLVYRTNLPARRTLRVLIVAPFFVPVLVTAVAWSLLTGSQAGLLNRFLRAIGIGHPVTLNSLWGIAFVLCIALVPIAFVFIRSAIAEPDAEQEEAAMVAGASAMRVTLGVTLPRILPSIGATVLFMFVLAAGNFSATGVLGIPWRVHVLSAEIYVAMNTVRPDFAQIAVIACMLLALLGLLLFFQFRLERRQRTGDTRAAGKTPVTWDLGFWKWPAFALVCVYLVVALVLPVTAIVVASLLPYWGATFDTASFDNIGRLFGPGSVFGDSIGHTLYFAALGASITVIIGGSAAYIFRRLRPRGAKLFDAVSTSSIALPGIIIGLGYVWLAAGSKIYGTLTLMILVVTVQLLPFSLRLITAGLTRVDVGLDEAARVSGAREWQVFWHVVSPQIARAAISGWILIFLIFTHELDAVIMVAGPGNAVLATEIYQFFSSGTPELAAAAALFLLALTVVALGLFGLLIKLFSGSRSSGDVL